VALLAAVAGSIVTYRTRLRPWQQQWGATEEARVSLPGDEFVSEPAEQSTRAITVNARPSDVWPWVIQLGADRGGFYSYERLENLFRLGIANADRVVPEWQQRQVGDLVFANASGTGGWYVMQVLPPRALVLKMADVAAGRPARRDSRPGWEFLWTFVANAGDNDTTRLVVRERVGFGNAYIRFLMGPVGLVSFLMTQRMLRGIKARAEAAVAATPASTTAAAVAES
jgi:hypothetical protein